MLKQNWQLGGRGVCVPPMVWHRCWCHQSSDPMAKTLSGPGLGGIFRNSPSSRFPSGPFQQDWPHPSPRGSPRGPPAPSLPISSSWCGAAGSPPQCVLGTDPCFSGLGEGRKTTSSPELQRGFFAGLHFSQFLLGFLFLPPFPKTRWGRGDVCSHRHPHDVRASFPSSHPSRGDLAGWGPEAELAAGLQVGQIPPGAGFGRCPGPPSICGPGTPCKTSPEPPSSFRGPFSRSIWGQDPSPGTSCPPWGKG